MHRCEIYCTILHNAIQSQARTPLNYIHDAEDAVKMTLKMLKMPLKMTLKMLKMTLKMMMPLELLCIM